jgi:hypothetical protein
MMMMLYPGAGIIISWESDCSPLLMAEITTSPGRTPCKTGTEIMFNYPYISPPAPILPLLKPKAHVCILKMGVFLQCSPAER